MVLTPRMLIPRKALTVVKKLLGGGDTAAELAFGEGAIHLSRKPDLLVSAT